MTHHNQHADHDHSSDEHRDVPPWQRPVEPDHPMTVEGGVTTGNTELMFRCMVEEYLLAGHSLEAILEMCHQPNYQAFYAAMQTLGEEHSKNLATDAARRVGRHHVRANESTSTFTAASLTIGASDQSTSH